MSQSTTVMDRLAWRAKWRRRWETWKTRFFLFIILLVGIPTALLFTPWFPDRIYAYILENRIDPITKKADPWAVESMYQLGRFYSITLREEDGAKCYDAITEWQYGYRLSDWKIGRLKPEELTRKAIRERKIVLPPEAMPWLGYAVFRLGEYMDNTKHKQFAYDIYKDFYLPSFEGQPGENPEFTTRAKTFVTIYKQ